MRKKTGNQLSRSELQQLVRLLGALTCDRKNVCACMAFALGAADCASDVVDVIVDSLLCGVGTPPSEPAASFSGLLPISRRVAHLFVISDILHNSSQPVPHASLYRTAFQKRLPEVFTAFHTTLGMITGRITLNNLKERVLGVLRVWETRSLYPTPVLEQFTRCFLPEEFQKVSVVRKERVRERERECVCARRCTHVCACVCASVGKGCSSRNELVFVLRFCPAFWFFSCVLSAENHPNLGGAG